MKTSRLDNLIIKGLTMSAGLLAAPHALPQTHEIAVTLARPQAVTEIVLPALGDHPVYAARQLESRRESDGQYCRYVYADGSHEILDKVCSEKPTPLFVRYNCREWTAVSIADGALAVRPKTLRTTFGDDGKMFAELDLTGSELTVSLFLVGDRIGTTTCSIWHPFEESIVYAVEIHVEGGKVSATADLAPVSNARVSVDSLDDIRVDLAGATLRIDTLSNNQIDAALLGGLATLAPLPGVVPLVAAGAYALLEDIDVANLALLHEIGAAVHGTLWGGCDDRDDCLARIAEGVIAKLDEPIVDAINDALDKPLEFERTVRTGFSAFDIANSVGTEITAELASLSTSSSENALTTFWDVAVTNLALGTCAGGITGYTAPSPVLDAVADGDITVAVPFSLVGDAVARVLPQLDLCRTPFSFAGFTGSFAPNGNVAVARGGPRKLRLAVPLRCNATAPARGRYTFDAVLEAHPELGRAGEIELVLDRASITNLAGQIVVPLTGKTQARYVFGATGACVSVNGGPCVDAPDFGPALEAAANAALAPLFPRTLVQRSTLYVAPHVYLREQDIAVADTSFALGATIVDGSRPVDLAVARFEAAGPSTDSASAFGTLREIPLAVV
ncbi:MAG: hypothetical protein JNL97_01290, partial [Verrucomicrobiales bacterium]|nr:hypothetical protein [Verrucomicrobiales bacterium]